MKKVLSCAVVVSLMFPFLAFAGILHWPMLGGTPLREGIASSIPEPPLEILWQTSIGMSTFSAPLTDGENLYLAGGRYGGAEGGFFCLDYMSGKISWKHDLKGAVASTPVISGGKIIGACNEGHIYGRDLNGAELYGTIIDGKGSKASGVDNATSVFFGLEGSSNNLISIDAYSGKINWKADISSDIQTSPCAYAGLIFAAAADGLLYAVNDTTGNIEWTFEIGATPVQSPMVVNENILIPTDKGLVCIHLAIQKEDVKLLWFRQYFGAVSTMPCTDGNMAYFGCENGKLYSLESSQQGTVNWTYDAKSKITCSPVFALGKIVFGCEDGTIYIFDTQDKEVSFKIKLPAVPVAQPLALWDRIIVSCSNGEIVCIGVPTEKPEPPEPPNPPEPPPPEPPTPPPNPPPKEHKQPVFAINAPQEAFVEDEVPIFIEILGAQKVSSFEFALSFDALNDEYKGFKPGSLKDDIGADLTIQEKKDGNDISFVISSQNGISSDGNAIEFVLVPKNTGTQRVSLLDSKVTFDDGEILEPQIVTDSFEVKPKKPMAEISLTPPEIDLGTVYSSRKIKLRLTQRNGDDAEFIVRSSSEACLPNIAKGIIGGNNGLDIELSIDPSKLPQGSYEIVVSVNLNGQTLKSLIKFVVPKPAQPNEPQPCIEIEPASLDFGYIPRGKEISLEFALNFNSDKEVSGVIKPDKNWLRVSPATFKTRGGVVTGIATIVASELPGGSDFTGHILITSKDKICRDILVEAKVQTQPSIVLELDIGVKKAMIGSMTVDLDQSPRIKENNRTVVPIRFVSESFGCSVQWEAQTKKVTITRFEDTIILWIGKKEAVINGKKVQMDVAPVIEDNGTLVPIRFISQAFGAKVDWFHETKHITITYTPPQNDGIMMIY